MPITEVFLFRMIELPSKQAIAAAFGRRAPQYKENARLQSLLLQKLSEKILRFGVLDKPWLDAGSGTGILSDRMESAKAGFSKKIISIDLAYNTLPMIIHRHGNRSLQGDIELLPFRSNVFGGIVLASVLQWTGTPERIFTAAFDKLTNNGILVFSIFVKGSFNELCISREETGLSVPILLHYPATYIQMMQQAGFTIEEHESFVFVDYMSSALKILQNIASIGGTAVAGKRMTRSELQHFCTLYERRFRTDKGIPLTFKAILGIARKKEPGRS
jgi:malonyl-CoA O-methyltransferase